MDEDKTPQRTGKTAASSVFPKRATAALRLRATI